MFICEKQPCKTLGEGFFLQDVPVALVVAWQQKYGDGLDQLSKATEAAAEFVRMVVCRMDGEPVFSSCNQVVEEVSFKKLLKLKDECLSFCGLIDDPEEQAKN